METFKIPHRKFINYFRALEAHYGNNVCKWVWLMNVGCGLCVWGVV